MAVLRSSPQGQREALDRSHSPKESRVPREHTGLSVPPVPSPWLEAAQGECAKLVVGFRVLQLEPCVNRSPSRSGAGLEARVPNCHSLVSLRPPNRPVKWHLQWDLLDA